jgi:hypothetical protein
VRAELALEAKLSGERGGGDAVRTGARGAQVVAAAETECRAAFGAQPLDDADDRGLCSACGSSRAVELEIEQVTETFPNA